MFASWGIVWHHASQTARYLFSSNLRWISFIKPSLNLPFSQLYRLLSESWSVSSSIFRQFKSIFCLHHNGGIVKKQMWIQDNSLEFVLPPVAWREFNVHFMQKHPKWTARLPLSASCFLIAQAGFFTCCTTTVGLYWDIMILIKFLLPSRDFFL